MKSIYHQMVPSVGNYLFFKKPEIHMVETRSMAAQHDQVYGVDGLETSISDGACLETLKVNVLKRKIQGLTMNMQLLMKQKYEIILELRGRRTAPGDGDTGRSVSNPKPWPRMWRRSSKHHGLPFFRDKSPWWEGSHPKLLVRENWGCEEGDGDNEGSLERKSPGHHQWADLKDGPPIYPGS